VLVFTAEEVWGTRFPDADSVHLLEWPELPIFDQDQTLRHSREGGNPSPEASSQPDGPVMDPRLRGGDELVEKWNCVRLAKDGANFRIEELRRTKAVGSGLQADVRIVPSTEEQRQLLLSVDLAEMMICAQVELTPVENTLQEALGAEQEIEPKVVATVKEIMRVFVIPTTHHKCGRCWRHLPEVTEDGALCGRCADVLNG
jgi:isoleucyl-tRNA synthetase